MVGTRTDITEQRERELAAAQRRARLERIAQHVPGMLYEFELGADRVPRFACLSESGRPPLCIDRVPLRALVVLMGGQIRIHSRLGAGTSFEIALVGVGGAFAIKDARGVTAIGA